MYMQQKQRPLYIVDEVVGEINHEHNADTQRIVDYSNTALSKTKHYASKDIGHQYIPLEESFGGEIGIFILYLW